MRKQRWLLTLLTSLLLLSGCNGDISSSSQSLSSEETLGYGIDEMIDNTNGSVYYEVFVRSFADSNYDGKGDLAGLTSKLPYLKTLGVKGLWLMPIHPSPSYHGYDVEDYYGIHKDYGTMADFEALMSAADEQNIDIIIDLVLNHSSSTHPWYIEGRDRFRNDTYDPHDPHDKANWYNFYWHKGAVKAEAVFGDWMPDLNLDNTAVRAELRDIIHFWLDKGVKGFRLDATSHFYAKDSDNVRFLQWFTSVVKEKRPDYYNVAEAWIGLEQQRSYYNGIESLFNFTGAGNGGYIINSITNNRGDILGRDLANAYSRIREVNDDALVSHFLSNHDMDRSSRMFLMDYEERQKLAASVYLLTPGVPFMYYGEEIGLRGSRGAAQTDANRRLPMVWQRVGDEMRPDIPQGTTYNMNEQVQEGVAEGLETPFSLLNHYRKVINIRNKYPWFPLARIDNIVVDSRQLTVFKLSDKSNPNTKIYVVHNLYNDERKLDLSSVSDLSLYIDDELITDGVHATLENNVLTVAKYSSVILKETNNA